MNTSIGAVLLVSVVVVACGQQKSDSKVMDAKVDAAPAAAPAPVAPGGTLLDYASDQVVQKFLSSSFEQLKAQKFEPKTDKEELALEFLRNDSQARAAFLDKIAAPVLNKMFECGMIP